MGDVCTTIATMRAAETPIKVTCLACGLSWLATIDTLADPCVHCGDEVREKIDRYPREGVDDEEHERMDS